MSLTYLRFRTAIHSLGTVNGLALTDLVTLLLSCLLGVWVSLLVQASGSGGALLFVIATGCFAVVASGLHFRGRWRVSRARGYDEGKLTTDGFLALADHAGRDLYFARVSVVLALITGLAALCTAAAPGRLLSAMASAGLVTTALVILAGLVSHGRGGNWRFDVLVGDALLGAGSQAADLGQAFRLGWSRDGRLRALRRAAEMHPDAPAALSAVVAAQYASSVRVKVAFVRKSVLDELRIRRVGWQPVGTAAGVAVLLTAFIGSTLPAGSMGRLPSLQDLPFAVHPDRPSSADAEAEQSPASEDAGEPEPDALDDQVENPLAPVDGGASGGAGGDAGSGSQGAGRGEGGASGGSGADAGSGSQGAGWGEGGASGGSGADAGNGSQGAEQGEGGASGGSGADAGSGSQGAGPGEGGASGGSGADADSGSQVPGQGEGGASGGAGADAGSGSQGAEQGEGGASGGSGADAGGGSLGAEQGESGASGGSGGDAGSGSQGAGQGESGASGGSGADAGSGSQGAEQGEGGASGGSGADAGSGSQVPGQGEGGSGADEGNGSQGAGPGERGTPGGASAGSEGSEQGTGQSVGQGRAPATAAIDSTGSPGISGPDAAAPRQGEASPGLRSGDAADASDPADGVTVGGAASGDRAMAPDIAAVGGASLIVPGAEVPDPDAPVTALAESLAGNPDMTAGLLLPSPERGDDGRLLLPPTPDDIPADGDGPALPVGSAAQLFAAPGETPAAVRFRMPALDAPGPPPTDLPLQPARQLLPAWIQDLVR